MGTSILLNDLLKYIESRATRIPLVHKEPERQNDVGDKIFSKLLVRPKPAQPDRVLRTCIKIDIVLVTSVGDQYDSVYTY